MAMAGGGAGNVDFVDWKSSKLEESLASFRVRALKEAEDGEDQ